jgi:6-pyruvoyltetrahydropterin/6-carboxytetrahydropterin synthase
MFQVSQAIPFCYGHRLLHYQGKCGRLHGHNGVAVIELRSPALDAQGMVVDFDLVQRRVQAWISETLDHKLLLHRDDPVCAALRGLGEPFCEVDFNPTAENIARMIFEHSAAAGLPVTEVRLQEMEGSVAGYAPAKS